MARGIVYGKTWWGNAWVEALSRIDANTNRLPRGRSYANTGKVKEIRIDEQGRVQAKVKGRRTSPYKVEITLAHFSGEEQEKVRGLIGEDLSLAAELSLGRLPESILGSMERMHVHLLPEAWDAISASCSCPDWANPCKHLAAVYYIMAGEIDKDPFMLFKLRGLQTDALLGAAGFSAMDEAEGASGSLEEDGAAERLLFLPYDRVTDDNVPQVPPAELEFPLDLSQLAEERESEALFALLREGPLFYPGADFKRLLLKAYQNVARNVERHELVEDEVSFKDTEFTLLYSSGKDPHNHLFFVSPPGALWGDDAGLAGREKQQSVPRWEGERLLLKKRKGYLLPAATVLDKFLTLPQKLPTARSSAGAAFLGAAAALAQALARAGSFVPELRRLGAVPRGRDGGSFYIAYRPLDRTGKLGEAVAYLASLMPPDFIYKIKGKSVLPGVAGAEEFLSIYLSHLVHCYAGIDGADKVCAAFFRGDVYRSEHFEEQQTARAISNWFSWLNLQPVPVSPVLKLNLPPSQQEKFRLLIFVEDKNDPLAPKLPLAHIFSDTDQVFGRPAREVRQDVARQLTIAGEYIPVLSKLLRHKGTMLAKLDAAAVGKVLSEGRQICELLGIRVTVPKALKQLARPVVSLAARTREGQGEKVSYLNLAEMLQFAWQVSLGEQNITREEFLELASAAEGVVKFREQYVMLDPGAVQKILEQLEAPLPQLSSMGLLQASLTGEAEGVDFQPDAVLQRLLEDLGGAKEVRPPATLKAELRPYQRRGFSWLYANTEKGLGSCLADDMGLGKTVQVLALLLKYKEEGRLANPVLIVCPTTLLGNWVKECAKFAPSLQVDVYHGSERQLAARGTELVMTSYGTLRRDREKFKRKKWELVIIDEAQNIKNPETDQTKAVKSLRANGYIAMSGTPVENRLTELWSIFDFINRGYLGKRQEFVKNMAMPIEKYRDRERISKLRQATAPFLLRRLKSDRAVIRDLPKKAVKDEYCYLSREQAALYQQVTDSMMGEIEEGKGIARKGLIFKLMTALKQICNHPVQYTKQGSALKVHSGKAEKALFLLENIIRSGEKALLFTQYREMGELLVQLLETELAEKVLFFHGGLSRKKRDQMVEEFQTNDRGPAVMIISLKAGGSGLNLTAASNVIHYDLWWNPAVEDQATDRTYRIGQRQDVQVYRLISLGTFEEKINEMISTKKELAALTVAAGESRLSELSNNELRELFTLHHTE